MHQLLCLLLSVWVPERCKNYRKFLSVSQIPRQAVHSKMPRNHYSISCVLKPTILCDYLRGNNTALTFFLLPTLLLAHLGSGGIHTNSLGGWLRNIVSDLTTTSLQGRAQKGETSAEVSKTFFSTIFDILYVDFTGLDPRGRSNMPLILLSGIPFFSAKILIGTGWQSF